MLSKLQALELAWNGWAARQMARSGLEPVRQRGQRQVFTFLNRYLAYRRLKPVVIGLPRRLANAFGRSDHYTFQQVKRAVLDLKLREAVKPYALAAACSLDELRQGGAGLSAEHYQLLRTELADLFDLHTDFTIKDLLKLRSSQHHPAPENVYASTGGSHPHS